MLKINQVVSAVAFTFLVSGPALAHQAHGNHQHGHAQEQAEIEFVRAEVVEVDLEHSELVLRHEAIEHLNMAAMTMAFSVADGIDITHLSEGDEIMVKVERQEQDFVIIEMDVDQHNY
ncbi:MAG: copper-binding protein [Gammaproteobacteria bacterium]|nr:copper-binding protein [Gammaproteobacteria bacterium]